jgi:hypothetical protein
VPLIHSGFFLKEVEILHFPLLSAQVFPLKYFRSTSLGKRLLFGVDPDLGTSCLTYSYMVQTREEWRFIVYGSCEVSVNWNCNTQS